MNFFIANVIFKTTRDIRRNSRASFVYIILFSLSLMSSYVRSSDKQRWYISQHRSCDSYLMRDKLPHCFSAFYRFLTWRHVGTIAYVEKAAWWISTPTPRHYRRLTSIWWMHGNGSRSRLFTRRMKDWWDCRNSWKRTVLQSFPSPFDSWVILGITGEKKYWSKVLTLKSYYFSLLPLTGHYWSR